MTEPLFNRDELLTLQIEPTEIADLILSMKQHGSGADLRDLLASSLVKLMGDRPARAMCIVKRLDAMRKIMGDERLRGWLAQGPSGPYLTAPGICAVARCPLRLDPRGSYYFDPDEFFLLALEASLDETKQARQ